MSLTIMSFRKSSLWNIASIDINANDLKPQAPLGVDIPIKDAFGMRWLRYIKNNSASALVIGDIAVKEADVTFTAAALTLGTRVTTSGLTADQHIDKMLIVEGNDTSAGAAPEGETGIITANSATVVDIDGNLPFSATAVADVDCRIVTPGWHGTQGGANALARDVLGVVAGVNGITSKYYGWVIHDGFAPQVKATAAGIAAGANVITAATGQVITVGAGTMEKVVGYSPGTIESTHPGKMPIVMTLLRARDVV